MNPRGRTDLSTFDNRWYDPGRPLAVRVLWLAAHRAFLQTAFPWPSRLKSALLRAFGARVGEGVVIKPRVTVKYPWNLSLGDHTWVGEGVWLDSLGRIEIGADVCLSQGVMVETGNHDWSKPSFDLVVKGVTVEDGAWAAVRSLLLPGSRLASHAVLGAGGVLSGDTEAYGVYAGNPAAKQKERRIGSAP
ncbi:WcaF family extracellular polysaccharide biosynthesis acetyltransferase [Anaeromyxobacter paludicola]|uniref:Colanic acid biosynthesis acetyltransferase WcaF n=1 Tax=Anaeromyxobacter paludicola TaxID=2918171 RepID=A0ABM7XCP5_9BACT|nr:WcaF family extracellular polysaccharide biosynthesis acetyltransferase [Anaeromyxobacter paludicola]BDG09636.1 colanic acid biosynthesis acetyltransferase WcaF [Anaeromyxobacter paludicola]